MGRLFRRPPEAALVAAREEVRVLARDPRLGPALRELEAARAEVRALARDPRLESVLSELVAREVGIERHEAADEPGFEPSPEELRVRSATVCASGGGAVAEYLLGRYGDQVDQLVRQLWHGLRLLEPGRAPWRH